MNQLIRNSSLVKNVVYVAYIQIFVFLGTGERIDQS